MSYSKLFSVFVVALVAFSSSVMAQASADGNATVTADVIAGLSISLESGSLAFGEVVVTGSSQTPSIAPASGASFLVTGEPDDNVTVTFSTAALSNGATGSMTFTADVEHTGTSATYSGAAAVTSGNTYPITDVSGTGTLYLWVGGSIGVGASQETGDYTGTFTVSVAY